MNATALTEVSQVSAETLEHVLGTGDISKLSTPQRVEYYRKTCESLGLNPLTRPIRFLTLNGQMQLYFTRDGTDQLRRVNGITLHVVDKVAEGGVYAVTVRARDKHGREDEDIGAVVLPQGGESRANALMKAITKAKRRVTLSICGLGHTDESELDTMPGARVFDADEEPPVVQMRTTERETLNAEIPLPAAAAEMPRPPKVVDPTVYDAPAKPQPERTNEAWWAWLNKLRDACAVLRYRSEVEDVAAKDTVGNALATGPEWVRDEIDAILAKNFQRFAAKPSASEADDELPEIVGEAHAAG